jgi:phosphoenolpyruvate synthase/pyruvate phosphate dikinase
MQRIIGLSEATNPQQVGPKAANLARMIQVGFRVPPGFVVVADALTQNLKGLIAAEFEALHEPYVAVRSSAASEDGNDASWAGQLETFLNVSRVDLFERIQDCIDSVHSARATAYAAEKGLRSGKVAVIVQAMVDSEVSGVAFSAHPVTGSHDQMVIEAGLGLGEAIVSGEITPDTYVVAATSGKVIESFISAQTKQLRRGLDGGNEWQSIDPAYTKPKLLTEQLHEITENMRKLTDFYGFPIDVEWAYAGGKLYILQARPITTL